MIASTYREAVEFRPLTVTFTLENAGEVQALYAVSNFSKMVSEQVSRRTLENTRRVFVPECSIESVLFHIWLAMKDAGIKSGASGEEVQS
jgi:hypothetical protein